VVGKGREPVSEAIRARRIAFAGALLLFCVSISSGLLEAWTRWERLPGLGIEHHRLGARHLHDERFEEAADEYRGALRVDRDDVEAMMQLATALERLGDPNGAAAALGRAAAVRPREDVLHGRLAQALARAGRYREAVAAIERAIAIDPDDPRHHFERGLIHLRLGDHEMARVALERAAAIDPLRPTTHNALGVVLAEQGNREEARRRFGEALLLQPTYEEARRNLARLDAVSGS